MIEYETPTIHILTVPGHYIGQRRQAYRRHWQTITGRCATAESALVAAGRKACRSDKHLRILFVPDRNGVGAYYGAHVVIEVTRK